MKFILRLITITFLLSAAAYSQALTISTVDTISLPGDTLTIPINAQNFNSVSSFRIKLQFDPQVLKWEGLSELNSQLGSAITEQIDGTVSITWTGAAPANITQGFIAIFRFTFLGGSSRLSFETKDSIIMDSTGVPIAATFIDGSVSSRKYTLTITGGGTGTGKIKVDNEIFTLPYSGEFAGNKRVTVEALPDPGNTFAGFSGDAAGGTNPVTITMDSDKSVTANFGIMTYNVTLEKSGNGQIKVEDTVRTLPFSRVYPAGAQIKIEALPDAENTFTGWSGSFTGTINPAVIEINKDMSITGNFSVQQYTLSVNSTGSGSGFIRVNGTDRALPYSGVFASGTQVTLEAAAENGSTFTGWSGDETSVQNKITFTITSNKNINAGFAIIKYSITINAAGEGGGRIRLNGSIHALPYTDTFDSGSFISIEAVPDEGNRFSGWGGDIQGTTNPVSLQMNGNKTVSVRFDPIEYTLTINKGGNGQVSINGVKVPLPFSALYKAGTVLSLEAVPDANSSFTGWSGDLTGKTNPVSLTIDKNKTVTALFDVNLAGLNISKTGNGAGQVKIAGTLYALPFSNTFNAGTQLTIEAVPSSDALFSGWEGDLQGSANPVTITLSSSKSINIKFELKKYNLSITKSGTGEGEIKVNGAIKQLPFSGTFTTGSNIILEAVGSGSSSFTAWGGDLSGSTNPVTFPITSARSITCNFTLNAPDKVQPVYPPNNARYISTDAGVSWNKAANAAGYHFQISKDSLFRTLVMENLNLTDSFINVKNLQYKTKYFWRVRGKNAGGSGAFSDAWVFNTKIEKIVCPTNLTGQQKGTVIELKWRDNSANESGFQVFRKNGPAASGNSYVSIASVSKDQALYEDKNIRSGEIYTYLIYAFNSDTISCYSNEFTTEQVTSVSEIVRPQEFSLYQNFPNPFNPATNIVFDLPEAGAVLLKIFDISGREAATLLDNEYREAGKHSIRFDGGRLASGEYIYLIRWKDKMAARKLILIK